MQELEKIYTESIELINSSPRLTTDQIPDHLLDVWLFNGAVTKNPPSKQLVSMAIYKHIDDRYGVPSRGVDIDIQKYQLFEYILSAEVACRAVKGKLKAMNILKPTEYNRPLNIDITSAQALQFRKIAQTMFYLKGRV